MCLVFTAFQGLRTGPNACALACFALSRVRCMFWMRICPVFASPLDFGGFRIRDQVGCRKTKSMGPRVREAPRQQTMVRQRTSPGAASPLSSVAIRLTEHMNVFLALALIILGTLRPGGGFCRHCRLVVAFSDVIRLLILFTWCQIGSNLDSKLKCS